MPQTRPPAETFVQGLFDADRGDVPSALRDASFADPGPVSIPPSRYFDRAQHDLEVERLWKRVWQMACRVEDIPAVGDHVVYEIADVSLLVTRSAPDRIQAFHNSCLHRGTQLRTRSGHVTEFRCPYHGFTWSLDGGLARIPCQWDFPELRPADYSLPEAQVATWGGFIFVNLDPDAAPLEDHLEVLPDHFASWPLEERYKSAHVVRTVACNWKVALEAFIEAHHVSGLHPQLLKTAADTATEYDIWPESKNVSRMITAVGVPSDLLPNPITDDEIVRILAPRKAPLEPGGVVRHVVADDAQSRVSRRAGREVPMSDAEAIDGIEYFLFPNFMPWPGYTTPLVYRFRPNGNDPESCIVDVMLLEPVPESGRPPAAKPRVLTEDETFKDTPELGFLSTVLNQDFAMMPRVQRGLRASVMRELTLSHYQESRIRHFHLALERYLND